MENKGLQIATGLDTEAQEVEIIGIHTLCRLCASQNERLIGIFSEEGVTNDLSNKINLYLPIKVAAADVLPLQCCWNCASTLLAWHELVLTSVEIDRKFRNSQFLAEKVGDDGGYDNSTNPFSASDDNEVCDNEGLTSAEGNIVALFHQIQRERLRLQLPPRIEKLASPQLEPRTAPPEIEHITVQPQIEHITVQPQIEHITLQPQIEHITLQPQIEHLTQIILHPATENQENSANSISCDVCEKILSSRSNYISHLKTHIFDNYCRVCCNSYNTKFKLNSHFTCHKAPEDFPQQHVQCDIENCRQKFPSKLQLHNHKYAHSNVVKYKCEVCGVEFVKEAAFVIHKQKHRKRIVCKICKKEFSSKKTLRDHKRIHTGEKPFKCQVCNQRFRCQSGLKYHEVTHTNEKKYRCELCGVSFLRSNYLKEHLRIHSKEKPFQCSHCNEKFIQMGVLKRHEQRMHVTCDECGVMVGKRVDLKEHKWTFHTLVLKKTNFECS